MFVGILTVSDSCYLGQAHDQSGPLLKGMFQNAFPGVVIHTRVVPDDMQRIKQELQEWSDKEKMDVIVTTGGTGFGQRDVTPEATKAVIEKEAPGMSHAIMEYSLSITPMAMLSRLVCGSRGRTVIVNMPGSPKAVKDCFVVIRPCLKHAVDLLKDESQKIKKAHAIVCNEGDFQDIPEFQLENRRRSKVNITKVAYRPRKSLFPLVTIEEASGIILKKIGILSPSKIKFSEALNRVLSEPVYALNPIPPFDCSIKDGYAVLASDGMGKRKVLNCSCDAGSVPGYQVDPGYCIRINTGAVIPPGADAIVEVEQTELMKSSDDGEEELEINILEPPKKGQDIRVKGSDIKEGQLVLDKGVVVGSVEVGLLASLGIREVFGYRLPTVGVLSTGNELLEPSTPLQPGKIHDSNRIMLLSLYQSKGFPTLDLGVSMDDPDCLFNKMLYAFEHVDVLVTTGGVSMGDKDLIKLVLEEDFKADIHFGRILMKPGKPTTFATINTPYGQKAFFGLPGNPVSALVTSFLFVIPGLQHLNGRKHTAPVTVMAKLAHDVSLDPRPEFHRCNLTWMPNDPIALATSTGNQRSSRLLSSLDANAMMVLPAVSGGKSQFKKGELVPCMYLGSY